MIDNKHESKPETTFNVKPEMTSHVKPDVASKLALGLGLPLTGESPQSSAVLFEKDQQANDTIQSLEQKILSSHAVDQKIARHAIDQKILGDQQMAQRIQEAKMAPAYNSYNKGTTNYYTVSCNSPKIKPLLSHPYTGA